MCRAFDAPQGGDWRVYLSVITRYNHKISEHKQDAPDEG